MNAASKTLRRFAELRAAGLVSDKQRAALERVAERYAVAITPAMAELIDRTDAHDPVARQFVPEADELSTQSGEHSDPIGDDAHSPLPGIVHRYPDRVLLKLTHVCAVYCRFCFRRETVGPAAKALTSTQLAAAFDYIAANKEIWETVLTGGDPLVLSPRRLRASMRRLAAIEHVKVIRIHTRIPAVDPELVSADLIGALKVHGKAVYVVLHANHPRELTEAARAACGRIVDAGIPMLSQSVLLKGINDDPDTLGALLRGFVECRIKPYYLHHADLAPGTAHLRTTIASGQALMRSLHGNLSGLCQPSYVLDIPGGHGKSPIGPTYIAQDDAPDRYRVEDFKGKRHCYPPTT